MPTPRRPSSRTLRAANCRRVRSAAIWMESSNSSRPASSGGGTPAPGANGFSSGLTGRLYGHLRVVDRLVASIASLPRLGFDGSMMKRHDDSQRSDRLAMTFGDLRVVDRLAASIASSPRLGFDGSMMTRHDDSQRGDRLAVTFGDPHESLTARRAYASVPRLGFRRVVMKRHDDSQRSRPLAMMFGDVRSVDRFPPACDGSPLGAGWMRMKRNDDSQRPSVDSGRRGSPPATDCQQNPPPALPAIQLAASPTTAPRGVVTQVPTSAERWAFA